MTAQNQTAAPKMQNPVAFTENGVPVFHVRKDDDDPQSRVQRYSYSFFNDNSHPIDVRTLPGYDEPEYYPAGNVLERSERWIKALATEAERALRQAMQAGLLLPPPASSLPWECPWCQHQQAAAPLPVEEQWGRCPSCGGN